MNFGLFAAIQLNRQIIDRNHQRLMQGYRDMNKGSISLRSQKGGLREDFPEHFDDDYDEEIDDASLHARMEVDFNEGVKSEVEEAPKQDAMDEFETAMMFLLGLTLLTPFVAALFLVAYFWWFK